MSLHSGNAGLHGSLTTPPVDLVPGPALLTVAQAAQWLNISIPGMRRLQQQRKVSFVKLGGRIRFTQRDLAAHVEQSRIASIGQ